MRSEGRGRDGKGMEQVEGRERGWDKKLCEGKKLERWKRDGARGDGSSEGVGSGNRVRDESWKGGMGI